MLEDRTILIFDDSGYGTLDLTCEVEGRQGFVAGPVATVDEAMSIIDSVEVAAAVVDCDVGNCVAAPLILRLAERNVPIVIQTSGGLPDVLRPVRDRIAVLFKPVDPRLVVDSLLIEIGRNRVTDRKPNKLGEVPNPA